MLPVATKEEDQQHQLVLFGLIPEIAIRDVEKMFVDAKTPCLSVRINVKHNTAFVNFASVELLEKAWRLANEKRLTCCFRCLRGVCKDDVLQLQLSMESKLRLQEEYENPSIPFMKLLQNYRTQNNFPDLIAPPKVMSDFSMCLLSNHWLF
jgi:hypothetical protein